MEISDMTRRLLLSLSCTVILAACTDVPPPPRSVSEFMDDRIALQTVLTVCNADRSRSRTDIECRNAREAGKRISVLEEAENRRAFETESKRKLEALRRRNAELEERVRRAEEEAQRRAEELYNQQFENPIEDPDAADRSGTEIEPAPTEYDSYSGAPDNGPEGGDVAGEVPAETPNDGAVPADDTVSDLEAVRQELERRRSEEAPDPGT